MLEWDAEQDLNEKTQKLKAPGEPIAELDHVFHDGRITSNEA
jgi:hypothetical protein